MKRIIYILAVFAMVFTQIKAQNSIQLNIHHFLGESDFAMNEGAQNNLNNDFSVNRLEYYISEISLIHDGGTITSIPDLWILVNAAHNTSVDLGDFDISSVEKIQFNIGVDPDHNHLDPAAYSTLHPLGPKSPSMHWGWASGYRFIAIEGDCGDNLSQEFQLHGLGDINYFSTEIDLDLVADENQITIDIDADYTRAMENIDVSWGVIVHGDKLQAKTCIENFRDYVFSPSPTTSSVEDFITVESFNLYPNPIKNDVAIIHIENNISKTIYNLSISSIEGRQQQYLKGIIDGQKINLNNFESGLYIVNLLENGKIVNTSKIIIQ